MALDFACTSGLRTPDLTSEVDVTEVFREYERHKRAYKDTEKQCLEQQLTFVPMIVEAHAGGMSPLMRQTLTKLADEAAPAQSMTTDGLALRMTQRISTALHRETARAILRRQQVVDEDEVPGGWEVIRDSQMAD